MTAIADVRARQILDSRGNPTVEVDVVLESGANPPSSPTPVASPRSESTFFSEW